MAESLPIPPPSSAKHIKFLTGINKGHYTKHEVQLNQCLSKVYVAESALATVREALAELISGTGGVPPPGEHSGVSTQGFGCASIYGKADLPAKPVVEPPAQPLVPEMNTMQMPSSNAQSWSSRWITRRSLQSGLRSSGNSSLSGEPTRGDSRVSCQIGSQLRRSRTAAPDNNTSAQHLLLAANAEGSGSNKAQSKVCLPPVAGSFDWSTQLGATIQRNRTAPRPGHGATRVLADEQNQIRRWIESAFFDLISCLMVAAHVVIIGVEVEMEARGMNSRQTGMSSVTNMIHAWYFAEFVVRLWAGWGKVWTPAVWKWFGFDLCMILLSVIELVGQIINTKQGNLAQSLRFIRMLRIVRTIRVIRALSWVHDFGKMIYAIGHSSKSFFWAVLLLSLITYCAAVCLTQSAATYLHQDATHPEKHRNLVEAYGSLPKSFLSLYKSILGGVSWGEMLDPLRSLGFGMQAVFLIFVSSSILGVANVVTSIFIDSAMTTTQHYKDLMVMEERENRRIYTESIRRMFSEIDADGSGEISLFELESFLNDPESRNFFNALDLQAADAWIMMMLMDKDGSGTVSIDEFCECCVKIKGEAKSFDMHCLHLKIEQVMSVLGQFMDHCDIQFLRVENLLGNKTLCTSEETNLTATESLLS